MQSSLLVVDGIELCHVPNKTEESTRKRMMNKKRTNYHWQPRKVSSFLCHFSSTFAEYRKDEINLAYSMSFVYQIKYLEKNRFKSRISCDRNLFGFKHPVVNLEHLSCDLCACSFTRSHSPNRIVCTLCSHNITRFWVETFTWAIHL